MSRSTPRTTIGLRMTTKGKLDRNRAPGQCYDGFLCQVVELWELTHSSDKGLMLGVGHVHRNLTGQMQGVIQR